MHSKLITINNEGGFVLVAAMLVLLVLAFIGISSTTTSILELEIAGNDKAYRQTFSQADTGAAIIGSHIAEENLACWRYNDGFAGNVGADTADTPSVLAGSAIINGQIVVERTSATDLTPRDLYRNPVPAPPFDDTTRDLYYPRNYGNGPHTNIYVGGTWTARVAGESAAMDASYDEALQHGYTQHFTIIAQSVGMQNSTSEVEVIWRHTVGLEGDCNY